MKAVDDRAPTMVWSAAQAGKIAATPGYMSAEPSRGEAATPASDVFWLAVMLYEMLIGAQAFAGQDVLELFQEIRNVQPDRYAAEVPEPFAGILRGALTREAEERVMMERMVEVLGEGGKS